MTVWWAKYTIKCILWLNQGDFDVSTDLWTFVFHQFISVINMYCVLWKLT